MDRQHAITIMHHVLKFGRAKASKKYGRNKIMHALHFLRLALNRTGA